ncbi:AAA family ATPase [Actinomadura sp. 3N508]|uniref:AAA family ATPase n=1 Tax=Actinomadura sp. 3N508 TaxID=3375153 RepID=UPI00379A3DF4
MVIVAGSVRSGKSTFARRVVDRSGGVCVGFGDVVRSRAAELGLPAERRSWQHVGEEWVRSDPVGLCEQVLSPVVHAPRIIVDGVRHIEVYALLVRRAQGRKTVLVFVDAEPRIRRRRLLRDAFDQPGLDEIMAHSTESELPELRGMADLLVDGTGDSTPALSALATLLAEP